MTVDDLIVLSDAAATAEYEALLSLDAAGTTTLAIGTNMKRAGVTAIVRALRDEIVEDGNCKYCVATTAMYNDILGSDAGEKVGTHGSPELDEDARKLEAMGQDPGMTLEELLEPPTDAAPAVCVWTPRKYEPGFYATPHGIKFKDRRYDHCGICGGEIKLTEANHG